MADNLTPQQRQAVTDRGGNLLVSAAAGSGKTKVLVDRLMSYLTDPVSPANLDEFLIITYTKAAAAELRGKIASKLSERIAEDPENAHLRQQMQRLYLTKISTVHAFCTDILREFAYRMDIPADFRVAEENECFEIQANVLERILNEAYANIDSDVDFYELISTQGLGRDDRQIPEIILKVYESARCHLNPDAWLDWCLSLNNVDDVKDAADTIWGQYLIRDLKHYIDLQICALERCAEQAKLCGDLPKPVVLLYATIDQLRHLSAANSWDDVLRRMDVDYGRLTFPKNCSDPILVEKIKAVRDACKKGLAKRLRRFSDCSEMLLADLQKSASAQNGLIALVRKFSEAYTEAKKRKRVLDFSDLEQKTLDLFLGKSRNGYTATATEVGTRFREVMVDEYQDSNAVQDAIFTAITHKRNNCFMVGDVKQSIYQFRLADPGIFLDKYNEYVHADEAVEKQGRKVLLSNNFRSSSSVINAVNDVFSTCMSQAVGGLDYGDEEALYEGIMHIPQPETEVELYAVDVQEDTYAEEAAFVANRISQLLDGTHTVRQGDILRPIKAEDIVILLRSPGSVGWQYVRALEEKGIHCATGTGTDLLHTEEIETIRAILQIVDNPIQDIPLISALSSRVFCFTADELAQVRAARPSGPFFSALRAAQTEKAQEVYREITRLREIARYKSIPQLLQVIFAEMRLDSLFASLPDGEIRRDNIQMFYQLACDSDSAGVKGLGRFLDYLNALEEKGMVLADDKGTPDAVTLMSIHKSKGLEFPVVFLCGLSREFNQESSRSQILCDKDLGLGLSCTDSIQRVRYPSIAKRAIAAKMIADSISEEMRVLYVAMTRPKDRLIMTYATRTLETTLTDLACRIDICDRYLLTADVDCPGKWVLQTALKHTEAAAFFALGLRPETINTEVQPWIIRVVQTDAEQPTKVMTASTQTEEISTDITTLKKVLDFTYPYSNATVTPSKLTATQLKGRLKDQEAAENAGQERKHSYAWRKPSFVERQLKGKDYGTALHAVMQYINYQACSGVSGVESELSRLADCGYISEEQRDSVDASEIAAFFSSEIGKKVVSSSDILREFKFSLLDNGDLYGDGLNGEEVLIQGVVDCALIEKDGITVIDFKTDRVNESTLPEAVERYRLQVTLYASALERIYKMPIKSKLLYFFALNRFVSI